MNYFHAIILAIIEGLTEFLPVSSTGHMILGAAAMGIAKHPFTKIFEVNIQFGAILAVVVIYWKRFFQSLDFYYTLLAAFIPAAVIGFLANDFIDTILENVWVVAISLLVGGIFLVFFDAMFNERDEHPEPTKKQAFIIGLCQCIAMIPGVSRSAASIIGGMFQGLSRKNAAEFSFFLAVPTMFAAAGYKLLKGFKAGTLHLDSHDLTLLLIGNVVAFAVAFLAIKSFIGILQKYGFKVFGYYRIVLGITLLVLLSSGYKLSII
jgi:undecaprenyl-diphosphatase